MTNFIDNVRSNFSPLDNLQTNIRIDFIIELISNELVSRAIKEGFNYKIVKENWLISGSEIDDFISHSECKQYLYSTNEDFTLLFEWGFVRVQVRQESITVTAHGDDKSVADWIKHMNGVYGTDTKFVEWVYNRDCDSTSLPMYTRPLVKSAYPWINDKGLTPEQYIDDFISAEETILILIGPPGTGKTSLIKHILLRCRNDWPAMVTYDSALIAEDSFFANFMSSSRQFLIIEDADTILASRLDGNRLMQKFLNLGEGLITTRSKKCIFTTNLPNASDIDPALLRPGRCFDVLEFRSLEVPESVKVCDELGIKDYPTKAATLAEITNVKSKSFAAGAKRKGFGFI